jgi:hypothetical protein
LDTEVEINSAWEIIRENIKISAKMIMNWGSISQGSTKDAQQY